MIRVSGLSVGARKIAAIEMIKLWLIRHSFVQCLDVVQRFYMSSSLNSFKRVI